MNLDTVFCRNDRVVSRKIVDELILVPVRRNVAEMESIYTLNDVGARVYELIDAERTIRQICSVIVEEFEVSAGEAERDVLEFLEKLLSVGSIEKKQ